MEVMVISVMVAMMVVSVIMLVIVVPMVSQSKVKFGKGLRRRKPSSGRCPEEESKVGECPGRAPQGNAGRVMVSPGRVQKRVSASLLGLPTCHDSDEITESYGSG